MGVREQTGGSDAGAELPDVMPFRRALYACAYTKK